ncbi:hypothetical protein [Neobacillus cucumis]|uniref:Uncharacterized protein n=1 Tax=Neobacillus cucumis TaxID=1740721 RepID=A0A2N5H8Q8_9BACI|nr:hypothetical protein [Neobacillus cucumis]PLS01902.1 hypothetical protein CVD27_22555 [Neobacillus cucumis]
MSIELLSKNTAGVFSTLIRQPHWEKVELQEGIKKVLLQIRESASSQEAYLESLLRNVTFQYANTNTAISFLTQCIEEEQFFSQESFHSIMINVPKQVQDSNFIAENMPRFKELVYKGSTMEEQVLHAETFFFHTKLVNDLMVEFIGTFLQPNNREFMVNFLEYSSQVVIDAVMHYCQTYSNLMIEELNSTLSIQ